MTDLPPLSFEQFLMSLSTAALLHLGEVPHPETNQKKVDLPQAKQTIDILGLLREKTAGNLTDGEQRLLDVMLAELRMRYLSLANAATATPSGNA